MERETHARLEELLRRIDIIVGVDAEIAAPALTYAGLCGQVKYVGDTVQEAA